MKYCGNCGSPLEDDARFCGNCGSVVEEQMAQTMQRPTEQGAPNYASKKPSKGNSKVIIAVIAVILLIVGLAIGWYFMSDDDNGGNAGEENVTTEDGETSEKTEEDKLTEDVVKENNTTDDSEKTVEEEITVKEHIDEVIEEEIIEYQAVSMNAVKSVTATSALSEYNMTHYPERVVDGNRSTGWVEAASGQGTNESITINFDANYEMNGIIINAGFQESSDLYYKNSRPSEIRISFSDGSSGVYSLQDVIGDQEIRLDEPVIADSITFTILSVYAGNKYSDTVISEIYVY